MEVSQQPDRIVPPERLLARVAVQGLVKTFGSTSVLRGVSLNLLAGTITVLTGPNGAGKSTLLSILSTQGRPTRGQVQYLTKQGQALDRPMARHRIGWVSHQAQAYLELSARENLTLTAELYGARPERVAVVTALMGLSDFENKPLFSLSRGQLQRVALGRALIAEPDFLLLDEPWTGLDQAASSWLEQVLRDQAALGAIVFIVSHQRDVIDKLGASEVCLSGGLISSGPVSTSSREPRPGIE
jgi:heme exporter protein A